MVDSTNIRVQVIDAIRSVEPRLDATEIDGSSSLADLNISSLQLVELGVVLEDRFGSNVQLEVWIDRERAREGEAFTLDSMIEFVAEAVGKE